ncbi:MAG: hypothetical protein LUH14_06905 [Clostridiaceae bacterium]|nr:hypothetical protein [Clostridiaceae bacterium]
MSKKLVEPAKMNYFFGPGWEDLGKTIKRAFQLNSDSMKKASGAISDAWTYGGFFDKMISLLKNGITIIIILILGTAYVLLFSAIHIAIVTIIMFLCYVVFAMVWAMDRIYLLLHKARTDCPVCKRSFLIPAYRCSCGEIHYQLVPGKYGVWKHKCKCGSKLPSTFLTGRSRLEAMCPECNSKAAAGEVKPVVFQLIGGSGSGKTVYLTALFHQIFERMRRKNAVQCEIPDEFQPYFDDLKRWYEGEDCPATVQMSSQMYPLVLDVGKGIKRQFSIYDIAGEMFGSDVIYSQDLERQFQYCDGLLFVIDPYGGSQAQDDDMDVSDFSNVSANNVVTNFVNYFISTKHSNATKRSDKKVSVLIVKSDVKEIKKNIGPAKIHAIYSANPEQYTSEQDCRNQVCKQYLADRGLESAINELEIHFKNVRYYPVSSMGHTKDGSQFAPWGVIEPLQWMLSDADRSLAEKMGLSE